MSLPLFYYPTTIVWVDDDALFLKAVPQFLNDDYQSKTFTSPGEAKKYFENYIPLLSSLNLIRGIAEAENYDLINHKPADLNIDAIKSLRNDENRHMEVSVIVVDYNMPEINGVELCRALQTSSSKKILLTGDADLQKAVSAFNEGIIDAFIRKDSPTLPEEIEVQLKKLTNRYFIDRTNHLLNHLEVDSKLPISDENFIAFFKEICAKQEIKEFYLVDKYCNFILKNNQDKQFYLVVHTDKTLSRFTELHADEKETMLFVRAVKFREKIPFFGEGIEGWELEPYQWSTCFYTPQTLIGSEKYYWSLATAA